MMKAAPKYMNANSLSYQDALKAGYLREGLISDAQAKEIEKSLIPPQAQIYQLRDPKAAKDPKKDYMRISFKEEDEAFLKDQERKTLTLKEMKKRPREVLQDGWDEDMSMYSHKLKP